MSTTVSHKSELDRNLRRLLSLNSRNIDLGVTYKQQSSARTGFQYLLVVIPFGSIHVENLPTIVSQKLSEELILKGYRPKPNEITDGSDPRLELEIESFSLSAYDLLFVRNIYCALSINAKLFNKKRELVGAWSVNESNRDFRRTAFKSDLKNSLETTVDQALERLLKNLNI